MTGSKKAKTAKQKTPATTVAVTTKKKSYSSNAIERMTLSEYVSAGGAYFFKKQVFYDIYSRNGDVRACIIEIAKRVGVNGIFQEQADGKAEPFEDKAVFSNPTWYNFKLDFFRDIYVSGECYMVPIKNLMGDLIGCRFLDPRSMSKKVNEFGIISAFMQTVGTSSVSFSPDELLYVRLEKSTRNENDGMGLLEGVIYDALTDSEAMKRNLLFFENGMSPNSIIMLDPEMSAEEQQLAQSILEEQYGGNQNSNKTIISAGIKDVKSLSLSQKDIDFINQRKLTTEKVCAILGVPRSLLGYVEDVNLANAETLYRQYIRNTIRPAENFLEYALNSFYVKFASTAQKKVLGKDTIKVDGENAEDRSAFEKNQREDVKLGIISINEAREERGLKVWANTETNGPMVPTNQVFLDAPKADTATPTA